MTTMIATCSLEKKNIDVRKCRQTCSLTSLDKGHMIVYMSTYRTGEETL